MFNLVVENQKIMEVIRMDKLVLDRKKRKVIESIFEHETPNGEKCYSIHFVDSEDTVWCDDIFGVYIEIEKYIKNIGN